MIFVPGPQHSWQKKKKKEGRKGKKERKKKKNSVSRQCKFFYPASSASHPVSSESDQAHMDFGFFFLRSFQ